MIKTKNIVLKGKHDKPILVDLFFKPNKTAKPLVVFCHGHKDYKDWGAWNLVANTFENANIFFVKFNFSHNGTTVDNPIGFNDLEAFGHNTYTKEMDDLDTVLTWVLENPEIQKEINFKLVTLIGYSRGGGIACLTAHEDVRITRLITWSSVSDFGSHMPKGDALSNWEKQKVEYIENKNTGQKMPYYFSFYEDFKANEQRFHIKSAVQNIHIPHLIIHGDNDEKIPLKEARNLHLWNPKSELVIIPGMTHNLDSRNPWKEDRLPEDLQEVVDISIGFIVQ